MNIIIYIIIMHATIFHYDICLSFFLRVFILCSHMHVRSGACSTPFPCFAFDSSSSLISPFYSLVYVILTHITSYTSVCFRAVISLGASTGYRSSRRVVILHCVTSGGSSEIRDRGQRPRRQRSAHAAHTGGSERQVECSPANSGGAVEVSATRRRRGGETLCSQNH